MTLHVVQLGPIPPPEGGISRNIQAIRSALLERGDRCSVIATSKSTSTSSGTNYYYPRTPAALLKLLRSLKADIVHLHLGGDLTKRVLMMAAAVAMLARGRSVLTVHSGEYPKTDEAKAARRNSLAGRVFRGFSHVIAVNDDLADVFERFDVPRERISVITPFSPQLPDPGVAVPPNLDSFCGEHSPLLVWVGGMERDYDPKTAIEAFQKIVGDLPRAGLMMIGGGSMSDDVGNAVAASPVSAHIHLGGNIDHSITLHLMSRAHVVLRTTLFDGDAISVREALFLGTPVVASETGNRPAGLHLFKIGDAIDLLSKIKEALGAGRRSAATAAPDNSNILSVLDVYDNLSRQVLK